MPEAKFRQIDQFRIVREIGRGGMGVVYLAEEQPVGRQVALKLMPLHPTTEDKALKRFEREIRATAKLEHPNIVRVYAVGDWQGQPYYTMEFVDGTSLSRFIHLSRQGGDSRSWESVLTSGARPTPETSPVDATLLVADEDDEVGDDEPGVAGHPRERDYYDVVARLIRETAEALDYAHRQGVIHRDIKPSNLMVDGTGRVRITDFGLAIQVDDKALTQTGSMVGTPQYMSPEQLLARRIKIDARTDVYSLGATLYELLTLTPAFSADTRARLMLKISIQDPKAPQRLNPHAPRDLAVIAVKAMEKNPDHRYQSAQLMADDIGRFLHHEPILAVRPSLPARVAKFVRRRKALSAAIAAGIFFLPLGAATAWQVQKQRRQVAARALVRKAEEAENAGRLDDALGSLRAALALDSRNMLVAAAVDRIRADARALKKARERKRRELLAAKKVEEAQGFADDCRAAREARQRIEADIKTTHLAIHGVLPFGDNTGAPQLDSKFADLEAGHTQAVRDEGTSFTGAVTALHQALMLAPGDTAAMRALSELYFEAMIDAEERHDLYQAQANHKLASLYDDGSLAAALIGEGATSGPLMQPVVFHQLRTTDGLVRGRFVATIARRV